MDRRGFLKAALASSVHTIAAPMVNRGRHALAAGAVEVSTRAVDLVAGSTVVDMLGLVTLDWSRLLRWQTEAHGVEDRHLRLLLRSGVNVYHNAVELDSPRPYPAAARFFERWGSLLPFEPCYLTRVAGLNDILRLRQTGRVGVLLGLQNATHLRTLADVDHFHRLGQRVCQLTYNDANRLGSGCRAPRDRGLTAFGAEVVAEMNRVGMAVDVSHCGDQTSLDAALSSRRPVLATHTNCRALVPGHPRCKPDEVIRGLAAGGGVIGITLVRRLVAPSAPTLEHVLDHFDHVARLVGVESVGIGSDLSVDAVFPGTSKPLPAYDIAGVSPPTFVFQLADGLIRRGYDDRQIELILGGNFLRALSWIWPDEPLLPVSGPGVERRDPFCPPVPPGE